MNTIESKISELCATKGGENSDLTANDVQALKLGFRELAERLQDAGFLLETVGNDCLGPGVGRMIDSPTCLAGMTSPPKNLEAWQ